VISRDEALALLKEYIEKDNLFRHLLATEAVLRSLARRFGADEELWGLTGLLHDIDLDLLGENLERHGLRGAEMLAGKLPEESLQAIRVHPGLLERKTDLDWALYFADPVTGLITAGAYMRPSRSLVDMDLGSLKRKFKDKRFAAGADRNQIRACEHLGLELDDFLQLALDAMREVHEELGI